MVKNSQRKQSLSRIDRVDPIAGLYEPKKETWMSVLKSFNPFGVIAEAYAKTLLYKIETKRLELELIRIREQSNLLHEHLEKAFQLKMEELHQRRLALMSFYNTVNQELERLHIERTRVLEMAQEAHKQALTPGISMEERQLYKELALEMTKQIPLFGDQANQTLQKLVQALPPVEVPHRLLED